MAGSLCRRRGEVRPRLAAPAGPAGAVGEPGVHRLLCHRPRPAHPGGKRWSEPAARFSRARNRPAAAADRRSRRAADLEDIIQRCYTNPRRIFHLPEQPDTYVEIDPDRSWTLSAREMFTRCRWTPFEGVSVRGKVTRVVLRGSTAYEDGRVLSAPGSGLSVCQHDLAQ